MKDLFTLRDLFYQNLKKYPKAIFLETWDKDQYRGLTYQEVYSSIKDLGAGLVRLGLKKGERIVLLGENSFGSVICYLAIVFGGFVVVPLDKELSSKELVKLIKFAQVKIIFISKNLREKLDGLKSDSYKVYTFDPFLKTEDDILKIKTNEKSTQLAYEKIDVKGDDLASIVFTSATTGAAKGVMLTHYNFFSDVLASCARIHFSNKDMMLLILPLHHSFALTCGLFCPMFRGATVIIENNKARLLKVFKEKRPTLVLGVPRLFELLYCQIETEIKKQGKYKKWPKGQFLVKKVKQYSGLNIGKIIFHKLHRQLGGRLKLLVSGGAALPPKLSYKYFLIGFPLIQGWGLTELSPVGSVLAYRKWRFYLTHYYEKRAASIGPALDGLEVELIDVPEKGLYASLGEGELVASGPMVCLGYYNDEEANKIAFFSLNGKRWFKTGDVGKKDAQANLYITGRSKYVIVTSGGKNVHPEEVEEVLEQSSLIKEVVVLGHKGHGGEEVVALIAPLAKCLKKALEARGFPFNWENIYEIMHKEIKEQVQHIANYKWPSDFAITDYDEEKDEFKGFEKTTTLKIKRDLYKFSSFHSYKGFKKGRLRKILFKKL